MRDTRVQKIRNMSVRRNGRMRIRRKVEMRVDIHKACVKTMGRIG